jgi:hypothetical protein
MRPSRAVKERWLPMAGVIAKRPGAELPEIGSVTPGTIPRRRAKFRPEERSGGEIRAKFVKSEPPRGEWAVVRLSNEFTC